MKMANAHKRTRNALIHGRHCRNLKTRLFTSGRLFYTSPLSLLVAHELRRQQQNMSRTADMPLLIAHYINVRHMVRHPRCVFINYNWINQLSNTTIWWLDICRLLHRYQLHVSALMAIFRLID